jgi:hypothetical protein
MLPTLAFGVCEFTSSDILMACYSSILSFRDRTKAFGGTDPQHFEFPTCEGNKKPDPTKPMRSWRSAWRNLTHAIYCPNCGLLQDTGAKCVNEKCGVDIRQVASSTAGLRFHDLRPHAITELAESFASDQTIMSIAGHVSQRMLAHYSHVRLENRRKALDALSGGVTGGGYVTKHGTMAQSEGTAIPQVIENMVDVTGFEPATPCLQSRRYGITSVLPSLINIYKHDGLR